MITKLGMILAFTLPTLYATQIPDWVMVGILKTESKSYYRNDGSIKYVVKNRGSAGERGCFQITPAAFAQVKRRGEQFWQVEQDTVFCEEIAMRYLEWIDKHYSHGDWYRAIEMYNAGPNHHSRSYLSAVIKNSQ